MDGIPTLSAASLGDSCGVAAFFEDFRATGDTEGPDPPPAAGSGGEPWKGVESCTFAELGAVPISFLKNICCSAQVMQENERET